MQNLIDRAIEVVKALPRSAQDRIGQLILDVAKRHCQRNADLANGETELNNGMGIPADIVIAELKRRYSS